MYIEIIPKCDRKEKIQGADPVEKNELDKLIGNVETLELNDKERAMKSFILSAHQWEAR